MSQSFPDKPVHYCYMCGNRLQPNMEACWYCGAPTHREIRPTRRCPFCAEPIRREAVKCRHCGEFLDGRAHPERQPVRQMIVVDKDLLKAMSDLRLFPGLPVPDAARNVLEDRTVRAIEDNTPDEIQQPGVRVLPAPLGAPILLEYKPGGKEVAKYMPAPPPAPPLPPAVAEKPPVTAKEPEGAIDAELADLYRTCGRCKTELLADDNFCYYCGTQYQRTYADERRAARERRRKIRRAVKVLVLLAIVALIGWGVYLFATGKLTVQQVRDKQQTVVEEVKGTVAKGVEELKDIDPKAIAAARKCRKNLELIDTAKRTAAEKKGLTTGAIALKDVLEELGMARLPDCPSGGIYSVNTLGQPPTCSIGDNKTASSLDDHIITNP